MNMMKNKTLSMDMGMFDIAKRLNEECINEGFKEFVRNAALASLLTVPSIIPQDSDAATKSDDSKEAKVTNVSTGNVTRVKDIKNTSYNGLSRENLKNLIATIAYNETMTDYVKSRDKNIIYAFLNLVNNRAGGKLENVAKELKRPSQFYSFNKHVPKGVIVDKGYETWTPMEHGSNNSATRKIWNDYLDAVEKYLNGSIPNVIGNRNMLANKKIDNKTSFNSWGKNCDKKVGSQTYGYERSQDGYRRYKTTTNDVVHVVKVGETLSAIARKYKTTVQNLIDLNKLPNGDIIKVGQKLIVKKNKK